MKLTIEGEPKEIAALIFAVSERQIEEITNALKKEHDHLDLIFRAQQRRVPYD